MVLCSFVKIKQTVETQSMKFSNTILLALSLTFLFFSCKNEPQKKAVKKAPKVKIEKEFGFSLKEYDVINDTIQNGWTLSQMMTKYGISIQETILAYELFQDSLIGVKYIRAGKPFAVFMAKNDTTKRAKIIVYQPNLVDYVVFDFRDSLRVYKKSRPTSTKLKTLTGVIVDGASLTSTIHNKIPDLGITGELTESIAGIFAWGIDFFMLQPNDKFKVIYEQKYVENEPYGIGHIKATWFEHEGEPYYAFYFEDSAKTTSGYYDETGKEMKRMFLMAPVKFSRISSGYTKRRFHPVQKRWKSHLGTDYAAPTGTPIYSTADGKIIAARYSRFNGNYVKVKHNATYTTQYLHMSKIASGIHPGVHVQQGQVIGYVGSTGLATGPHVCYRFWKNGKQVNHRALKFPASEPLKKELLPIYLKEMKPVKKELDEMAVK